jgi:hypothetical protein
MIGKWSSTGMSGFPEILEVVVPVYFVLLLRYVSGRVIPASARP